MVAHKDVVLALLGASAGLAGLLLVFLSLVIGMAGGFAADTPSAVMAPILRTAWVCLGAFLIGIACIGVATWWLLELNGKSATLYGWTVGLFLAQLAALVIATLWTMKELLWV